MNVSLINGSQYDSSGIWYTVHKQKKNIKNKMDEYTSVSMDHADICHQRRCNNNTLNKAEKSRLKTTVCSRCYSYIQATIHPCIRSKMHSNSLTLNNKDHRGEPKVFNPCKIQTINNRLRYISFGELSNIEEFKNIISHAYKNNHLKKALWTKKYGLIKDIISSSYDQGVLIGMNLNIIWSCSRLNVLKHENMIIPHGCTKAFYVYTNETTMKEAMDTATQHNIKTFRCKLQCKACNRCYDNTDHEIIMELIR